MTWFSFWNLPPWLQILFNLIGCCFIACRSRTSVTLWKVAIELEVSLGQMGKAKALLYRAVGECPWAKGTKPHFSHQGLHT